MLHQRFGWFNTVLYHKGLSVCCLRKMVIVFFLDEGRSVQTSDGLKVYLHGNGFPQTPIFSTYSSFFFLAALCSNKLNLLHHFDSALNNVFAGYLYTIRWTRSTCTTRVTNRAKRWVHCMSERDENVILQRIGVQPRFSLAGCTILWACAKAELHIRPSGHSMHVVS